VNNVEAAVMLRGTVTDEPIRTAWEFGEALWADPRRSAWSPQVEGGPDDEALPPELYAQLVAAVAANQHVFLTLGPTPSATSSTRSRRLGSTSRPMPRARRATRHSSSRRGW
jgi:hypothetical protein